VKLLCIVTRKFIGFNNLLYNKRVRPTKNEPQQGISYLERARDGDERERVGQQAVICKVRSGLGKIKGTDRETEIERHGNKET
jgi:hypothetical protein